MTSVDKTMESKGETYLATQSKLITQDEREVTTDIEIEVETAPLLHSPAAASKLADDGDHWRNDFKPASKR